MAIQVHIFRGPDRIFGVTADGTGENLPSRYRPWTAFKTLEMVRGQSQPGVNVDECLDDLDEFSFHITDGHLRITPAAAMKRTGDG
jgi:hypothetical protein